MDYYGAIKDDAREWKEVPNVLLNQKKLQNSVDITTLFNGRKNMH